jgi:uncharacterized protein (UPF0332 family)
MFDAARAGLLASGHAIGKTHKGVLSAFSDHLVKKGPFPNQTRAQRVMGTAGAVGMLYCTNNVVCP